MWMGVLLLIVGILGAFIFRSAYLVEHKQRLYTQLTQANTLFNRMRLSLLEYEIMFGNQEMLDEAFGLIEETRQANIAPFTELGIAEERKAQFQTMRDLLGELNAHNRTEIRASEQIAELSERILLYLAQHGGDHPQFYRDFQECRILFREYYLQFEMFHLDRSIELLQRMERHTPTAIAPMMSEWDQLYRQMVDALKAAVETEGKIHSLETTMLTTSAKAEENLAAQVQHDLKNTLRLQIGIFSFVMLFGLLFSRLMAKSIAGDIDRVVSIAETAADGDFASAANSSAEERKDELGKLQEALQKMSRSIREVVHSIQESSHLVANASEGLSQVSDNLSSGANSQAASAEEISSAMEQMSSTIDHNAGISQKTKQIALEMRKQVLATGELAQNALQGLEQVDNRLDLINEIANQTNILALNAAVEAARAGEHGRGFAVVAAEVRKLAENSRKAAEEIEQLSANTLELTRSGGRNMGQAIPLVEQTVELVEEIAASLSEQRLGADQINSSVAKLSHIIQENASASEEMTTGSEELSNQASQLNSAIAYFTV